MIDCFQISSICYNETPILKRELQYIIETVEDCSKHRATKNLRVLRDLFSIDSSKRKLATHVLKKAWDILEPEDILKESFDLSSCSSDAFIDLNVYSTGLKDYSFFDYKKLYTIFKENPEISLKKTSIEQLSILINDREDTLGVSGRRLYREDKKGQDVFSLCLGEILQIYSKCEEKGINYLHPVELNYLQELLRFLTLSFLFYFDEPVIVSLIQAYHSKADTEEFEESSIMTIISALTLFLSSKQVEIRKNSLRCLQVILLSDQVKTCINMTSGMPYFSVPTYMIKTYEFLFPVEYFKYSLNSKINLLNSEEKHMVELITAEDSKPRWMADLNVQNWFDALEKLPAKETFKCISNETFRKLVDNTSSISRSVYNTKTSAQIKDSFEIVPSDTDSAKLLAKFYLQLRLLLKDLKAKIHDSEEEELSKHLRSFLLLIITKMRELNLPYHYVYSQIIECGIENRQTHHLGQLKLTEYA